MSTIKSPNGNIINFDTGGREAIERLVSAYGFATRQALADHLNVSKSTLANRYLRDTFPSDWIIQCAMETGTSLSWLATGIGPRFDNDKNDIYSIKNKKIINGHLFDANYYIFDKAILPADLEEPMSITFEEKIYIVDINDKNPANGEWLVDIEGETSIRKITLIPIKRVKVTGADIDFECSLEDIKLIAKCRCTLIRN